MLPKLAVAAVLSSLTLAPSAHADRFYLGSQEDVDRMTAEEGSEPDVVEGVLLKEEGDNYVIRVEGGEITIPKAMVFKVDKDDLSVADLEGRENDAVGRLAEANAARQEMQAVALSEKLASYSNLRAAEAAARAEEARAVNAALLTAPGAAAGIGVYDPVLDISTQSALDNVLLNSVRTETAGYLRRYVQQQVLPQVRRMVR